MARSIWSGSVSFGLVNIPVKLFSAVHRARRAVSPARARRFPRPHTSACRRKPAERSSSSTIKNGRSRPARTSSSSSNGRARQSCAPGDEDHRHRGLRRARRDRSDLLRAHVLPRARRTRPPPSVRTARGGHGGPRSASAIGKVVMREQAISRRDPSVPGRVCACRRCSSPTRSVPQSESRRFPERDRRSAPRRGSWPRRSSTPRRTWDPKRYHDDYEEQYAR